MNDGNENERWTLWISTSVTIVAVAAIAVHLAWPGLKIDFVTVTLLAIACLPWLRGIVSSVDLPGGASVNLVARQRAVVAREQQETIEANQAVATVANDVPFDEKLALIDNLADEYEQIRENMPSGNQRTQSMGRIVRSILSLMPLDGYDPYADLLSSRAGRRLVAYLALFAGTEASRHVEELIRTLTEREGIPYNQSWALRALSKIVAATGMNGISSKSVARLKGMRDGLRPGSDRQLLLADLVDKLS